MSFRSAFSAPIQGCKRVLPDRSVGACRLAPRGGSTRCPVCLAILRRQPSGVHDGRVSRLVTLRAAAAIGAVALMASCTAQATHAVTKPEISPANGGIPPNISVTPGSQIPPVSMPRMQPGLPAAIRLVTSDKHRFLALPSGRIEPVGQQHGNGEMLPPRAPFGSMPVPRGCVSPAGMWSSARDGTVVWRSRGTYNIATANALWSDAYSPAGAAFQIGRRGPLYVAPSGGAERRVALGEWADGWTRSGTLLTLGKEAGVHLPTAQPLRDRGRPRGGAWAKLARRDPSAGRQRLRRAHTAASYWIRSVRRQRREQLRDDGRLRDRQRLLLASDHLPSSRRRNERDPRVACPTRQPLRLPVLLAWIVAPVPKPQRQLLCDPVRRETAAKAATPDQR